MRGGGQVEGFVTKWWKHILCIGEALDSVPSTAHPYTKNYGLGPRELVKWAVHCLACN